MNRELLLEKYPRTKKFLEINDCTLNQALVITENELLKLRRKTKEG